MSKKGIGMKNATELIKWIATKIAQIILWIEDGTRTVEELMPLEEAIQAVIERKPFQIVLEPNVESLKDLAASLNPAEIYRAWVQLYAKWGIQHSVPEVPYTKERIQREKGRGRILIYLAPELSSTSALVELGKLFPEMQSWAVSGDSNAQKIATKDRSGWMFVEQAFNMPNFNTTEDDLRKIFSKQNAEGMSLNCYIIFGQFCKEVFGEYPDVPGYVRLLGSSCDGSVLLANFDQVGNLEVNCNWSPDLNRLILGGRSVTV